MCAACLAAAEARLARTQHRLPAYATSPCMFVATLPGCPATLLSGLVSPLPAPAPGAAGSLLIATTGVTTHSHDPYTGGVQDTDPTVEYDENGENPHVRVILNDFTSVGTTQLRCVLYRYCYCCSCGGCRCCRSVQCGRQRSLAVTWAYCARARALCFAPSIETAVGC